MKPKYIVRPGWAISKNDEDRHWITADQLIGLYQVDPRECVVSRVNSGPYTYFSKDLILLQPRYDGNYELEN